nr:PIN domain-containing protein [Chloroflexota bacterium]
MRDLFPVYYKSQEDVESVLDQCLFVFDTNILLHIYKYRPASRRAFFSVMGKLSRRIWIPYQVALEFQQNRLLAINAEQEAYNRITKHLTEAGRTLEASIGNFNRHANVDTTEITRRIKAAIEAEKLKLSKLQKKHPDFSTTDPVRDIIDRLFKDKIGTPYSREQVAILYQHAQNRFAMQIPPGYKDSPRTGDLVIWFQLLDHARAEQKPIVFVTDDAKEDWWTTNPLGPRTELVQEMYQEAGVGFYMLLGDHFLKRLRAYLKLKDRKGEIEEAIEDAREIREQEARIVPDINHPVAPAHTVADYMSGMAHAAASIQREQEIFSSMRILSNLEDQLPELRRQQAMALEAFGGQAALEALGERAAAAMEALGSRATLEAISEQVRGQARALDAIGGYGAIEASRAALDAIGGYGAIEA